MLSVTIVVPTRNEQDSIAKLLYQLSDYHVIVVDDSDDCTPEIARSLHAEVIKGQRKGLGQAIIDGIKVANSDVVLVMDADCSHDPESIPDMLKPILDKGYDMTIGSRYVKNGKTEGWEFHRRLISRCACLLALPVTTIRDSTSGFFAIRKSIIENIKLEGKSWKIMLEILTKAKPTRVCEVPITFKVRESGKSKFNSKQMIAYLKHLFSLCLFKYNRFLKFCMVGGTGSVITFGTTFILTEYAHLWYILSLAIAVVIATFVNYTLNCVWTFSIGKNMNDPDYEWRAYYKGNFPQRWWKQSIVRKVLELLPENMELLSYLDIGCGSSPLSVEIGSPFYVGVDSNKRKIEFMRKKGLPFVYEQYKNGYKSDVVMAIEVIEHCVDFKQAQSFIREMSDSTKLGGKVIIATPDYSTFTWRFIEKVYSILMPSAYASDHKVKFNEGSLVFECLKYGLKHIETKRVLGCDMVCSFVKRG